MRAYFFCNQYLSAIQQGIQSAHCLGEMFVKYCTDSERTEFLYKWARKHKTIIVLNGGFASQIDEIAKFFARRQNPFPWAKFKEEKAALNNATTCTGIILPERVYTAAQEYRVAITPIQKLNALSPLAGTTGSDAWTCTLVKDILTQYSLAH